MSYLKLTLIAAFLCLIGSVVSFSGSTAAASGSALNVNNVAAGLSSDACAGLKELDSTEGCGSGANRFKNLIASVVRILSYLVGVIAIIMIMVAGFKYITSSGNPEGVSSAKNTLIYALIGIVVAVLAQFLVEFVLTQASK